MNESQGWRWGGWKEQEHRPHGGEVLNSTSEQKSMKAELESGYFNVLPFSQSGPKQINLAQG